MHRATQLFGLAYGLVVSATIAWADPTATTVKGPDFETLKGLEGEWIAENNGRTFPVTFHIVSAGSAVMERFSPGAPDEMVTVYTREGNQLAVTHFCVANNQPRLLSRPVTATNKLRFEFESGGNMNPSRDFHSHNLTITFIDNGQVREVWEDYKDGKLFRVDTYTLKRKT